VSCRELAVYEDWVVARSDDRRKKSDYGGMDRLAGAASPGSDSKTPTRQLSEAVSIRMIDFSTTYTKT